MAGAGPVVIGAGIAGLAVAHELTRRGIEDVLVLEAAGRAGGNIRTHAVDGYTIEEGPNGFLDNVPATLRLAERLNLTGRLFPSSDAARKRYLWRRGASHRLPEGRDEPDVLRTTVVHASSAATGTRLVLADQFGRLYELDLRPDGSDLTGTWQGGGEASSVACSVP